MEVVANTRRKINSWHPPAVGFTSTNGSMETSAGLGQIQIRCKNSHHCLFKDGAAGRHGVDGPSTAGKGEPCTKLEAGRRAWPEGPFPRVLPGAWEEGTTPWAETKLAQEAASQPAPEMPR